MTEYQRCHDDHIVSDSIEIIDRKDPDQGSNIYFIFLWSELYISSLLLQLNKYCISKTDHSILLSKRASFSRKHTKAVW